MTKKKNDDVEPNGALIPKVERPLPTIPEESISEGKTAVTTFTDRAQAFMIMDARDDNQIIMALQGQFSEEYIYDIPFRNPYGKCNCEVVNDKHDHVRGLSVTGIREACRHYGAIQCQIGQPKLIEENNIQYYETWAEATDLKTGVSEKKWYRVPLVKALKSGGTKDDPFAYQICQSKAERNAKSVLLPQELIRAWLQDYASGKKVLNPAKAKEVREKQKQLNPPDQDDEKRDKALATIFEKLNGLNIPEKHHDQLLCKIAEHHGNMPTTTIKNIDSSLLPNILAWLLKVKKQSDVELNDFSSLYGEVLKEK